MNGAKTLSDVTYGTLSDYLQVLRGTSSRPGPTGCGRLPHPDDRSPGFGVFVSVDG